MSTVRSIALLSVFAFLSGAAWPQNNGGGLLSGSTRGITFHPGSFYFAAKGSKQGALVTESAGGKWEHYQIGLTFDFRAEAPLDRASGLPTGQLQCLPLTLTRQVGPASPQFLSALATNEVFPQILIQCSHGTMRGDDVEYELTLQNARLTRVRQYMGLRPGATTDTPLLLEELVFSYQSLTAHHVPGNTMAVIGK